MIRSIPLQALSACLLISSAVQADPAAAPSNPQASALPPPPVQARPLPPSAPQGNWQGAPNGQNPAWQNRRPPQNNGSGPWGNMMPNNGNNMPWGNGNRGNGNNMPWGNGNNMPWGNGNNMPWGNGNNMPWGNGNNMPWGNGNNMPWSNGNNMPWNNNSNMMPWNRNWQDGPWNNRQLWQNGPWQGGGPQQWMLPNDPKGGMVNMWDDMINTPNGLGRMPGGWKAPSISVPNPIEVGDKLGEAMQDMPQQMQNFSNSQ